jgi:phenylalanyl-tRNA synthetase beta chain
MKISYNWLNEYLPLAEVGPEKVAEILTSIGLEVESMERIETVKGGLQGIVVGEVLTCVQHPDADRLHLTTVNVGSETLQIVCGAPNVAQGQKVAVAVVGTTLYPSSGGEMKIKKSKIRGIDSFGMICAEDELGLGTSHDGIMTLSADAVAGAPLRSLLNLDDDVVYEIGLTPNRIDAASHYGVARDLAAYFRAKATLPDVSAFMSDNNSNVVDIEIQDTEGCPRYSGLTVSGVTVRPSPEWLQKRLNAIGIRPKNNIVDITNYILHELGQPLHAFDADKIEGGRVVVRTCNEGDEFVTLDGETRRLQASDVMICDSRKPMCIGGVFGGVDSGVTDATVNVFIESAYFNPVRIRKTSRHHGLLTDASFRFERGADPNGVVYALKRAALLIKELGDGEISSDIIDVYPQVVEPAEVQMTYSNIARVVGKKIPDDEIRSIVKALEMQTVKDDGDAFTLLVPTYRVDVRREFDVIEDILRIYGYNRVEIPAQVHSTLSYAPKPDKDRIVNAISDFLSATGYREIMSNSLTKSAYYEGLETYKPENSVRILNPLSNELNVMRQTLLFGGLEAIARNINHKNPDLKFYEHGNVYAYREAPSPNPLNKYREEARIALFVTGDESAQWWNRQAEPSTFFTLKSTVEQLLQRFGCDLLNFKTGEAPTDIFADGFSLGIDKNKPFLTLGVVAKSLRKIFDIAQDVFYAEISLSALLNFAKQNRVTYSELPRFPEVRRDLALVIDKSVTFATLHALAFKTERKLLKQVGLFDIYEGDRLPEGKKQYALSFILRDDEKTLTDKHIEQIMSGLLNAFVREAGAELR